MTTTQIALALVATTWLSAPSFAQAPPAPPAKSAQPAPPAAMPAAPAGAVEHSLTTPAEVKWGDGPPSLPPGAKMAVMYGDPGRPGGLFLGLLKVPAGYKIPAHWHPTDETVTVLSGTVQMGMGDKLDAKTAKSLPAGSMAVMPAKHNHYFIAKTAVTIQVSMLGPFEITYINPDDDPRKGAAKPAAAPAMK